MSGFWEQLITTLTSATVVLLILGWVARRLIDNFFSHKIEQYRSDLEKENTKFRITYERLHAERAEAIKDVYKKLVDADDALDSYIRPMQWAGEPSTDEKAKTAGDAVNGFSKCYRQNRVFFAESVAKKLDEVLRLFLDIATQFHISRVLREENSGRQKQGHTEWQKAFDRLRTEVPPLKAEIEKQFRSLIGIE